MACSGTIASGTIRNDEARRQMTKEYEKRRKAQPDSRRIIRHSDFIILSRNE